MTGRIYQLHVTLRASEPPIWRRLEVRGATRLSKLHDILQRAMGWTNSHLHQFLVGAQAYSDPAFEVENSLDEQRVTLESLRLLPPMVVVYEYDFGDDWIHDVVVEAILSPQAGVYYPQCVAGERTAPPEDCGGLWGYQEFLAAISDPTHPEHAETLTWVGGAYDPAAFDLAAVNRRLRQRRWAGQAGWD